MHQNNLGKLLKIRISYNLTDGFKSYMDNGLYLNQIKMRLVYSKINDLSKIIKSFYY